MATRFQQATDIAHYLTDLQKMKRSRGRQPSELHDILMGLPTDVLKDHASNLKELWIDVINEAYPIE